MLLAFGVLYCFLLVDFSSVSSKTVVLNHGSSRKHKHSSEKHDDKNDASKNTENTGVLKQLHRTYSSDLKKKDDDLHHLLLLKQQYIVRNHIEEFEIDYALNFEPDWSKLDKWSSTVQQGIEIRRQKWEYIFEKHSDVAEVQSLIKELAASGVNQSIFCREIAEAYFILSHNSYIYKQGPVPNENGHKVFELVHHPVMDKSLKIFMHTLPDSNFKFNETEDLVQIPKSVYHKLLRKDAQISMLKKQHERKKNAKGSHEEGRKHAHHHHHHHRNNHHQHHSEETRTDDSVVNENPSNETTTTIVVTSTTTEGRDSSSSSSTDGNSSSDYSDDSSSDDNESDVDSWQWTDSE